ncbi:hypothetical protein [Anaerobaca lacustris]|uniref:Uncharacterized protein n=1 Tax=Anaerobaca lacustris TaxID=3044600 RepID=A0AAW6U4X9_9BACT|nr:hypothetical protein [Sedimentisphaerales bacterium M17dextr]
MGLDAGMTILKMLETLPEPIQDRVVEHLREYIKDLRDEASWNEAFSRTEGNLAAAARQARREVAEGKATPLDPEML